MKLIFFFFFRMECNFHLLRTTMFTATKMAPYSLWLFLLLPLVYGQVVPTDNYVFDIDQASCSALVDGFYQFFDSVTMACKKCSQNSTLQKTSDDGKNKDWACSVLWRDVLSICFSSTREYVFTRNKLIIKENKQTNTSHI